MKFNLNDIVKITSNNLIAKIVELRGNLGPKGCFVYRLKFSKKNFVEVREDQIELVRRKEDATNKSD